MDEPLLASDGSSSEIHVRMSVNQGGAKVEGQHLGTEQSNLEQTERNKLSTFMGVFVPCCLSIFGIVLFERLAWIVGYAGVWQSFGMVALALSVTLPTTFSMCAIATNGVVKGGGLYFMISRALGPEMGGAVGMLFFFANVFSSAFYLKGFAEEVVSTFICTSTSAQCIWNQELRIVAIASISLCALIVIALMGANAFARSALLLFVIVMFSMFAGLFSVASSSYLPASIKDQYGIVGPNMDTLQTNLGPAEPANTAPRGLSWVALFAIAFNGFSGINAGANMSGDLENPSKSLPLGTLGAIFFSAAMYIVFIVLFAASVSTSFLASSGTGYLMMQYVCRYPALVYVGVLVSLFASGLSTVMGAARILQAVCRDKVLPKMHVFGTGSKKGDEPIAAVLLTWVLVQASMFIQSIGAVTTIAYLISYATMNFTCLILRVSGTPNFRPTFRFFSWQISLFGTITSLVVAFLIEPAVAGGVSILCLLLVIVIGYSGPETEWGDISQAIIYHQVRKYLLRLDERRSHVKYWRPSIMTFLDSPSDKGISSVLQTCNGLKKGGLFSMISLLKGSSVSNALDVKSERYKWQDLVHSLNLKAFGDVLATTDTAEGAANAMLMCGLGSMRPNIIVFPLGLLGSQCDRTADWTPDDVCRVASMAIDLDKTVLFMHGFENVVIEPKQFSAAKNQRSQHRYLDVWCRVDPGHSFAEQSNDPSFLLSLQLAWILHTSKDWISWTKVRVLCAFDPNSNDGEDFRNDFETVVAHSRVRAQLVSIPVDSPLSSTPESLGTDSSRTLMTFVSVDRPPKSRNQAEYMAQLSGVGQMRSSPTVFVHGTEKVITSDM